MKVILTPCPVCDADQEAEVIAECATCSPPHADVECIYCGNRWYEPNPMIYERANES
jgi:RecJ-like exonuclease